MSCPPGPALYDRLSGRDNLRYAAELYDVDRNVTDARITEAAARFEIADALAQRVGGYSTGMRPASRWRAVLHEPDLLLLDEPTAGLDPESARTVLGLIDEMAEGGKTVLMCTHLLLEAEGLADQVVVMDHGHAMVAGSPGELGRRYWPAARVLVDADDPRCSTPRVSSRSCCGTSATASPWSTSRRRPTCPTSSTRSSARARGSRVEPQAPSLEELYFAIRRHEQ